MAQAYTRGDSLGIYETLNDIEVYGLGGAKGVRTLSLKQFLTSTPIPQLVVTGLSGKNPNGECELAVSGTNSLIWTPLDGTPTTAVTIAANETKLIESSNASQWVRVFWDGDYSTDALGGADLMTLFDLELDEQGAATSTTYIGSMISNHSALAQDVTSIKAWIGTLGTQRATGTAQLGASGAGTITTATANGFADWPDYGWAHVRTSGGTSREIVYYTSRTATSLTVPSGGRGLLGTSAAAGSATDTVDAIPGVCIAKETADSNNRIQVIANNTTEPTGVTWNTGNTAAAGLDYGALASNANAGLWLKFDIPAVAIPSMINPVNIEVSFIAGGVTYYNSLNYNMRIRATSYNRYELFAGVDANPTLTGAASTTSATLPFTYALSAPVSGTREHRITVRKRNVLGLSSLNNYYRSFTVDNTGALVASDVSDPIAFSLENAGSKSIIVRASYAPSFDTSPADKFVFYITDTGVDPDPSTDLQIELGDVPDADPLTGKAYITATIDGPTYAVEWGKTVKVLVRMLRSSDSEESSNLTPQSIVIDSGETPNIVNGDVEILNTITHSASPACESVGLYGQTFTTLSSNLIWRGFVSEKAGGRIYINNALALVNATISGSGTGDVEVIDANTAYLCVGGTRRAKIDLSAGTVSAAQFVYNGSIDDNVSEGPISTDNGKLYISVYNNARQLWEPFIQLDSSGVMTFGYNLVQRDT
jgi:hypothetical protein